MDSSIFAKNKVTLVNVWNVGCTPCVNEIPDLDKINSEYKDKGAAVYGLYGDLGMGISDDEMAQIKDIMSNANASYTQLRMDGTLATNESLLNIMAYPTTYVVGSDGTILDTIEGSKDYEGWKALIDSLLSRIVTYRSGFRQFPGLPELTKRGETYMNIKKRSVTGILLLAIGVLFILNGIHRNEHTTVQNKSNIICLECIGIG